MGKFKCLHCKGEFDDSGIIKDGLGNEFCCNGCKNVYGFLNSNGLGEFYERLGKENHVKASVSSFENVDNFYKNYVKSDGELSEIYLIIDGIHCSACVWLNEKVLANTAGVTEISINAATNKAQIKWDDSTIKLIEILNLIKSIGYNPVPYDPNKAEARASAKRREFYAKMLVGVFCTMNIMWVAIALYGGYFSGMSKEIKDILHFAEFVLASPVLFYTGSEFFRSAYVGLKNKTVGMDLSVAAGASIAYIYSVYAMLSRNGEVYFDSVAMIITFVFIGKFLEVISKKKAIDSLDSLSSMLVNEVSLKVGNSYELRSVNDVRLGDIIIVRAGERVLIDGVVVAGAGSFDYSSLSGESLPVLLAPKGVITSGAICLDGSLEYEVTTSFEGSMLSKIIALLESASLKKPNIEKMANQISAKFSLTILAFGLLTFLFWAFSTGVSNAIIIAVSVIIIACPCALSLATPVATLVGLGVGLKKGIVFKEAKIIESLAKCQTIVFDKTGTLSKSKLKVVKATKFDEFDMSLLYSLLSVSTHPISKAVMSSLDAEIYELKDVQNIVGKGVSARYKNQALKGGSVDFMSGFEFSSDNSLYCFSIDEKVVAVFELADELRSEAKDVISSLKANKFKVIMLTGDNEKVASKVANELGISEFYHSKDPLQKAAIVKELNDKSPVVMVGDGINDAVALSSASVGISLGSGAALSVERSDVVLLNDDLNSLKNAILLSKMTLQTVKQNLAFSLVYNAVTVPLAMAGFIIPLFAAISMSLSSIIVVINSAALRVKFKG
ncbi:cytochrome oxidase maturation protein, cbb3-type [Campylobacter iguaniorum]|uniref:heavy metal translocating P-type ATPase n=1 Tax=Campylobacter iguaniorum TaxID=1244531 RepID=UPI00073A0878|nr:heavy metal translocating P-type ATPase [Campylobacter iguaniorum]ALV25168.1 cytochrome oxidase maturation protein, cbb3-type [Campylobacter iguaniorum]